VIHEVSVQRLSDADNFGLQEHVEGLSDHISLLIQNGFTLIVAYCMDHADNHNDNQCNQKQSSHAGILSQRKKKSNHLWLGTSPPDFTTCYNTLMGLEEMKRMHLLGNLELFSILDAGDVNRLGGLFRERIFDSGEEIFAEGDAGTSMMVVASGTVRISQKPDADSEEALILLKTGMVFGEMALLEELPRSATAIAHTPVILLEITRENFLADIENHPRCGVRILMQLARTLSSRLRETDLKLKTFINLARWI